MLRSEREAALVPVHEFQEAMEALSGTAWSAYRQLMELPNMLAYLQDSSPLEELSLLNIGSRPARRTQAQDARAICGRSPGCSPGRRTGTCCPAGTASAAASRRFSTCARSAGLELLRRMFREARLFRLILDDVERTLLQVDLTIAREYAGLVEDAAVREPIFDAHREEYRLTCEMILRISGGAGIAERFPQFRGRLRVGARRPSTRSAAHQVQLLRAHRGSEAARSCAPRC